MILTKRYLSVFLLVALKFMTCSAEFKKVCYYTNWAPFRPTGSEFYPEDINPDLCTHVIYAFAKIENYNLAHTEDSDIGIDNGPGMYERIMALKLLNPSLKILLAVGGWGQGSAGFDTVVQNDQTMEKFAKNSIDFLRKWNFDGLDVDWEFPVVKKVEFTKLLEELRIAFDTEAVSGKNHLELSIAVSGGQATIDTAYEVDKISQLVDFVNLMAYDFHGSWSSKTGFHSGLYAKPGDLTWENTLNVDWSVKYWIEKGCPKEKLILGLAFYGRGFKLVDPSLNQVGAPSRGSSKAGPYTKEDGFLSYFEICKIIKENNLVESFDNDYQTPSVVYGSEWIGYENQESIIQKANYIKDKCLGGSMIWTVDFDDYKGEFCNQGVYPLLTIINEVLKDSQCGSLTKPTTKVQTAATTLKTKPQTFAIPTTIQYTQGSEVPTKVVPINHCNGSKFVYSSMGCEYFQVCLKGFIDPVATLKCPNNHWFDTNEETCVKERPIKCFNFGNIKTTEVTKQTTMKSVSYDPSVPQSSRRRATAPIIITTVPTQPSPAFKINNDYQNKNFVCPEPSGLFPNNQDCKRFWHCSNSIPFDKECPGNLVFDNKLKACGWTSDLCQSALKNVIIPQNLSQVASKNDNAFSCPQPNGLFENSNDCKTFWQCSNSIAFLKECPGNLLFNQNLGICDYKSTCAEKKV